MNGVRFCPSVQSTFTFRSINFCKIAKPNEKKMLKNSSKLFLYLYLDQFLNLHFQQFHIIVMHNESEKQHEYLLYVQALYIEQEYQKDEDVHRLILN
jgi:hypothetical protein